MNVPRLHGLVLAGGRSSRMRRDKAAIEFHSGETQLSLSAAFSRMTSSSISAARLGMLVTASIISLFMLR